MKNAFAVFHESHRRVNKDPDFFERFYDRFMASSGRVGEKFANTDFKRQKKALELSIKMVMMASRGSDAAETYLAYIAEQHDRHHLNIEPDLYDFWLEAMIDEVARSDPEFDEEIEAAWRETMGFAIEYMVSRY